MIRAAVKQLLLTEAGLDLAAVGEATVMRLVERLQAERGLDAAALIALLQADAEVRRQVLEAAVVPETWFLRDPAAFDRVANWVADRLAQPGRRQVWLLSIPCATGEEPYSLAITLRQRGLPSDRIGIDAVDLSASLLERAAAGCYGRIAFRSQQRPPPWHFFDVVAEGEFVVREEVRQQVRFHQGNLLAPTPPWGITHRYDAIFCRNLLIYFDQARQARALSVLARLLAPDGLLFLAPVESGAAMQQGWLLERRWGAFRPATAAGRQSLEPLPKRRVRHASPVPPPPPTPAPTPVPVVVEEIETDPLAQARVLADGGRLREAETLCRAALGHTPTNPDAHFLLGEVLEGEGLADQAEQCYRRTLFLEPTHYGALIHLLLRCRQQGARDEAERLLARVKRLEEKGVA